MERLRYYGRRRPNCPSRLDDVDDWRFRKTCHDVREWLWHAIRYRWIYYGVGGRVLEGKGSHRCADHGWKNSNHRKSLPEFERKVTLSVRLHVADAARFIHVWGVFRDDGGRKKVQSESRWFTSTESGLLHVKTPLEKRRHVYAVLRRWGTWSVRSTQISKVWGSNQRCAQRFRARVCTHGSRSVASN